MGTNHKHSVCTYEEAERAIRLHNKIYINHCFCRTPAKEGKLPWSYCGHETEVCLGFYKPDPAEIPHREITSKEALQLFESWKNLHNFFRFMEDEEWICFCCKCGCGWFRDKDGTFIRDTCDKSQFMERTDLETCNLCGDCIDVCPYNARSIQDDTMIIKSEDCFGCSICHHLCSLNAVEMIKRQ